MNLAELIIGGLLLLAGVFFIRLAAQDQRHNGVPQGAMTTGAFLFGVVSLPPIGVGAFMALHALIGFS